MGLQSARPGTETGTLQRLLSVLQSGQSGEVGRLLTPWRSSPLALGSSLPPASCPDPTASVRSNADSPSRAPRELT